MKSPPADAEHIPHFEPERVVEAAAAVIKLVEDTDHVSFVEIERIVPGFTGRPGEECYKFGAPKKKGGCQVYWIMSLFGWQVFDVARKRLALAPCSALVYLIDGAHLAVDRPDEFCPAMLRPGRTTNFVTADGHNTYVPDRHWARLRRALGKEAAAEGCAKAKAFVASLNVASA
jgi:hypothetical protein